MTREEMNEQLRDESIPRPLAFYLDAEQVGQLEEWRAKIKELHGKLGNETFCFSPTGIGTGVVVKNNTFNIEIDLSNVEDW